MASLHTHAKVNLVSMSSKGARYAFMVEWLDPQASMIRSYTLYFFTEDNSVEMDDIKNRRKFLKRVTVSNFELGSLFIGATVNVLGRHLTVVAFADDFTRNALGKSQECTFAMIKPNAFQNAGHIISALEADGFHIAQLRTTTLTRQQANAFYAEHAGKPFFDTLTSFMSSGPIVALQLIADNAITKWRTLIGPTNSDTARAQAPGSIRARFGKDGTQNAVHGSDSTASVQREVAFFFGPDSTIQTPFPYDNVSVCVIKPHVLHEKKAGAVLQDLFSAPSFVVAAIRSLHLSKTNAGEFLQVYDGVIPSFSRHVDELASGPCLAIALAGDSSIVPCLRDAAGPPDPEVGKLIRSDTLRAKYSSPPRSPAPPAQAFCRHGTDSVRNAVHVTDLEEDGALEAEYLFKIL